MVRGRKWGKEGSRVKAFWVKDCVESRKVGKVDKNIRLNTKNKIKKNNGWFRGKECEMVL